MEGGSSTYGSPIVHNAEEGSIYLDILPTDDDDVGADEADDSSTLSTSTRNATIAFTLAAGDCIGHTSTDDASGGALPPNSPANSERSQASSNCPICMEAKEDRVRPCARVDGNCVETVCQECLARMALCPFCRRCIREDMNQEEQQVAVEGQRAAPPEQVAVAGQRAAPPPPPVRPSSVPGELECAVVITFLALLLMAYPILMHRAAASGQLILPGGEMGKAAQIIMAVLIYIQGSSLISVALLRRTCPVAYANDVIVPYLGPPTVRLFQVCMLGVAHGVAFLCLHISYTFISHTFYVSCALSIAGFGLICSLAIVALRILHRVA